MDEEKTPQQWYVILRAESSLLERQTLLGQSKHTSGPLPPPPVRSRLRHWMTKGKSLQSSRRLLLPVSPIMCRYCAMHRNGCK
jgi:hypothetical protein